jgi:hypothetical protein
MVLQLIKRGQDDGIMWSSRIATTKNTMKKYCFVWKNPESSFTLWMLTSRSKTDIA